MSNSAQGGNVEAPRDGTLDRLRLINEWHARPNISLPHPLRCSHVAVLRKDQSEADAWHDINRFCQQQDQSGPAPGSRYHVVELGSCLLKWESHTEATSHTLLVQGNATPPFSETALDFLDQNKRAELQDDMIVGVHIEVLPSPGTDDPTGYDLARSLLGSRNLFGGVMSDNTANVWSSFRLDAAGFVRLVIIDRGISERRLARLLQRLLDMEMYRILAMKALPSARAVMSKLDKLEPKLQAVMAELASSSDLGSREHALARITDLAAEVEQTASANSSLFASARAYSSIVERRAEEVREEIVSGNQRYTNFLMRALAPAMRTCDAAERRLGELAQRVARSANLLSTMVDIEQSRQNQRVMSSMADNAKRQLRLQQAVEGFSIFAISYYAVGLIKYSLDAAASAGMPVDSKLLTGLAAPAVFALVFLSIRFVRRRMLDRRDGGD